MIPAHPVLSTESCDFDARTPAWHTCLPMTASCSSSPAMASFCSISARLRSSISARTASAADGVPAACSSPSAPTPPSSSAACSPAAPSPPAALTAFARREGLRPLKSPSKAAPPSGVCGADAPLGLPGVAAAAPLGLAGVASVPLGLRGAPLVEPRRELDLLVAASAALAAWAVPGLFFCERLPCGEGRDGLEQAALREGSSGCGAITDRVPQGARGRTVAGPAVRLVVLPSVSLASEGLPCSLRPNSSKLTSSLLHMLLACGRANHATHSTLSSRSTACLTTPAQVRVRRFPRSATVRRRGGEARGSPACSARA